MVLDGNQFVYDGTRQRFVSLPMLFLLSVLILTACPGVDIEDPTPPSKPEWVQKSLPEEWPERGIDAHESNGIYLEWELNYDEDIVTTTIYRATWFEHNDSLGEYMYLAHIMQKASPATEYLDIWAYPGNTYYYKLRAKDASDNLSQFSDSVGYRLLTPVAVEKMIPNGKSDTLASNRYLSWVYHYSVEMEDYVITLLTDSNELLWRENLQPGNYTGGRENWIIPQEIALNSGSNYKWRIDTGADYKNSIERAGSESPWATFLYIE